MSIPQFSGSLRDYPQFKAEFKDIVESRSGSNAALIYLKGAVPSTARKQISPCATMKEAWQVLEDQYGDEQLITAEITREIRAQKQLQNGQNKLFLDFIEKLQKAQLDLRRIDLESELL